MLSVSLSCVSASLIEASWCENRCMMTLLHLPVEDLVNANESLRAELTSLQEECEKQVREFSDMVASMRKSHQEAMGQICRTSESQFMCML